MSSKEAFAVDVPEALAESIGNAARDMEIRVQRFAAEQQQAFLNEVRPKLKDVKGFWTVALMNLPVVGPSVTASDREALKSLEDIELVQDAKDPRAYELIFHFGDNDFFTNKTISKKYTLPKGANAPADGSINAAVRDFDPEDLVSPATTIEWKDGKNLVELHPRKIPTVEDFDNEDFEGDVGSWFHYFTNEGDMFDVGPVILNELLADPYKWFQGGDEDEDELDEDEESDDDEGSVDLGEDEDEGPAKKKQRK